MEFLGYHLVQVTQFAAIAAYKLCGLCDEKKADQAAVDAMRTALQTLEINGIIVIGEGERDKAPMLYIGEKVGTGIGPSLDIAVDPLEGTTMCAYYKQGAMSVLAATKQGNFLHAPDIYMEKIAIGKYLPYGIVSLKNSIRKNLENLSQVKNCQVSDLKIAILKRKRHIKLIKKISKLSAKVKLIDDGDITAIISLIHDHHDMYIGIGGAPEGVLAASVLRSMGGQMEGRLIFNTEEAKKRAHDFHIHELDKIYSLQDMVRGESVFIATGITSGELLEGVQLYKNHTSTHSIIISPNKVVRLQTVHHV
ncbi:class II fructose-bisphosphatase [Wolbachia endosymbiont of Howardula sp.]|uniref:class II fructose-bisphosphatase n=1 Tax=Wolbachia endosymbiont of Howardula sp. TaxID=2916816 RepID=UPI00217E353C|nr:class II fructose-bisphosphatase [Wolbachia endosymbiont of Howardula sp.]UWI83376.1 class II fructose-bisphosphatase [Wolbachia endosymbiont of Howardula sp.]